MDSTARPSQQPPKMASSTGGTEGSSPASSPASAASLAAMAAPKFGTLVPNRIFVGGISASTSEAELAQLFSAYGNVKATKIIADRGGVSKGYGFVTFETEEEAKRLQQESECIVLRERKLNIAPAIKKQPFNRSFDGGTGSPPAVPTSTYYYTNGMGLPYQNSMTFYNAGAPAPGAAIAPPNDPATLYQAAGVFGPQPAASHQTFAPVMYPVPAPSLYMPQQYQYSPMPYEPYFQGTTAAGAPQFLYASNGAQPTTGGNGSGSNSSNTAAATTSPASGTGPSPQFQSTHFYGPTAGTGATHPHSGAISAGTPHGPPPPPHQMEHLYYSYPPPHPAQGPPHHGGPLALSSEQQLLVYTTEISGQPSANDSQMNQEDTRSTSSHSEQLQLAGGGAATSDSGGGSGGGGQSSSDPSAAPMFPIMPFKYSISNRYINFHPIPMPQTPQANINTSTNDSNTKSPSEDTTTGSPMHYRAMYPTPMYPTPFYMYHTGTTGTTGGSLLPTPPQQPYDLGGKYRDYSKSGSLVSSPYNKTGVSPPLHQTSYVKQYNGPPLQAPPPPHGMVTPPHKFPGSRISHPQYGKRPPPSGSQSHLASPAYYYPHKSNQRSGNQQPPFLPPYVHHPVPNMQKGFGLRNTGSSFEYTNNRRSASSDNASSSPDNHTVAGNRQTNRKSAYVSNSRPTSNSSNSNVDTNNTNNSNSSHNSTNSAKLGENVSSSSETANTNAATTTISTTTKNSSTSTSANVSVDAEATKNTSSTAPTTTTLTPTTRPLPNLSPSSNPNQVQFLGLTSQRYNPSSTSTGSGLSQQQRSSNTRYPMISSRGAKTPGIMRQTNSGSSKYKMNGIVSTSGKLPVEDVNLGGAGDAPPVNRLPMTPPATPQQTTSEQGQQLSDACHQMQALSL